MRQVSIEAGKKYSLEEYIKVDEEGTVRHEYYNGKLFEMPGASIPHNDACLQLHFILRSLLKPKGYRVNVENVKVKIENEDTYVYPDVLVSGEQFDTTNNYILHQPILIAEVLSDSTRKYDSTDKFILYQKISSLRYYLLVEPEKHVVFFYEKDDEVEWSAKTYTELTELISLPKLQAEFTLSDIYS
jgi:Uma2 family endonuclease